AAVAGMGAPLAVYGHQVYPELLAALAVVIAVAAIIPRRDPTAYRVPPWSLRRGVVLVIAVSALPWLSIKYVPVVAALAIVALLRMRRESTRMAATTLGAFAISGVIWIAAHLILYGGWTAYATGDHFEETGEFSVVGVSPDYLARSTRLIGLWVDRDYGLVAWQPAWLLVFPAASLLFALSANRRKREHRQRTRPDEEPCTEFGHRNHRLTGQGGFALHLDVLLVPLAAGLLTATFAALTMHGFWWPGRQMVVVLPLGAMVIATAGAWLHTHLAPVARRPIAVTTIALALSGVAIHAWTLTAGYAGTLTWVGAANLTPPQPLAVIRGLLPDYRELGGFDWALHFGWVGITAALVLAGLVAGARRGAPANRFETTADSNDLRAEPNHVSRDPHTVKDATHR
ncbi:MAG: hypothetical protein WBG36_11270, partial [Ornithinimicrobium sp.]